MRFDFTIYHPRHQELWDHRTPEAGGIGGTEVHTVEMARRLARRGHNVVVYAPIPIDCPERDPGGARWYHYRAADFSRPGVWIFQACPEGLDQFPEKTPEQKAWLVGHDGYYDPAEPRFGLTPERQARLDRALVLCATQEAIWRKAYPGLAGRIVRSRGGIRTDVIEEVSAEDIERDPYRLVYTSSADRGLRELLRIYHRAREWEPRLNLHVTYGWVGVDKGIASGMRPDLVRLKRDCEDMAGEGSGVTMHGRIPHRDVYRLFASAGLWVYPTTFGETCCVACMEAQALGAVPITVRLWGLMDYVRYGSFVGGDPATEPLSAARYAAELLRYVQHLELQDAPREEMMAFARHTYDWERVVDQFEALAGGQFDSRDQGRPADLELEPGEGITCSA